MSQDTDKEYWDGVAAGATDGPISGMIRDVGEGCLETASLGMIARSDDNKRGIEDGREGLHDDD